ncbi:adenylosuccinate lyase [Bacteroidetes bacterium UKL13-3]|jgi:adenylosuccinate lyase|nr:adenylosuccinate lyase [Bacteroidetes bacterium UKL13-3]HCP94247.1 adenylosuccinate lyase [Bacteroidota bacterium]
MEITALTAISPIDGRYRKQTEPLSSFYSEYALIQYRVLVEIEYFIALAELPIPQMKGMLSAGLKKELREIYINFTPENAQQIKDIERTTNHDVKAVEYFIKEKLTVLGLDKVSEFVHFGLTSQDINNTSIPLTIKAANEEVMLPQLNELLKRLTKLAKDWKNIPMLAHTHGQPASPTKLGKEILVFVERLQVQMFQLSEIPYSAKFGGATGNFNAHHIAYPKTNWVNFANNFLSSIGLERSQYTTQIEHYDNLAAMFDCYKRINTILMDLSRDMWQYISMEYFKQQLKAGEVGSSAMPHKVNPIDFENAEGNFGMANAIFEHLSAKLPISRLQRDLTDSTVLRNIGVPMGHTLIGYNSLLKGLNKLLLNEAALHNHLEENWAVVAEAIQTVLRREGYPKPYEALKTLTRTNKKIGEKDIKKFIGTLKVSVKVKAELNKITPHNYTGVY